MPASEYWPKRAASGSSVWWQYWQVQRFIRSSVLLLQPGWFGVDSGGTKYSHSNAIRARLARPRLVWNRSR